MNKTRAAYYLAFSIPIALYVGVLGLAGYVCWHFISKFW